MSTPIELFTQHTGDFIARHIVAPIVEHLRSKGVQVSADELINVLNLPTKPSVVVPTAMPPVTNGVLSNPFQNPIINPGLNIKAPVKATKGVPNLGGQGTCSYVLQRGDRKGSTCGVTVQPGSTYCKTHHKKYSNVQQAPNQVQQPGLYQPPQQIMPNNVMQGMMQQVPPQPQQASSELVVVPFNKEQGLYRESIHSFIVKQSDEGIVAIGRLDNGTVRELTDQERSLAKDIGLVLGDQQVTTTTTVTTTLPAPQVSVPPSIPFNLVPTTTINSAPIPVIPNLANLIPSN